MAATAAALPEEFLVGGFEFGEGGLGSGAFDAKCL